MIGIIIVLPYKTKNSENGSQTLLDKKKVPAVMGANSGLDHHSWREGPQMAEG